MTDHEQPAAGVALKPVDQGLVNRIAGQNWRGIESTMFRLTQPQAESLSEALEAPTDAGGAVSEAAKLVAYEDAHAVAVELGYPSLTEALEHLSELKPQPLQQGGEVTREQVEWLVRRAPGEEWRSTKDARVAEVAKDCGYEVLALFASPDLGDLEGLVADLEATESSHERRHREDNLVNPDGPDAALALRSLAADRDKAVGLLRDAAAHLPTTGPLGDRLSAFLSSQTEGDDGPSVE